MLVADRFLSEVHIGSKVELSTERKDFIGEIISFDEKSIVIKDNNTSSEVNLNIDEINYYEIIY